ncbi:MAG TPA: cutinase family protein [Mycobacterium sp.]|uniref:cutinase family protein n=1 Tax=Mycobacterium sp. TaxID=1785 RepID=UPI002D6B6EA1|nr:cutinase family protein [Mycobacterium sp.]HZU50062.1 cutinase family protein [Mycobacterium sp.]
MTFRDVARILGAAVLMTGALVSVPMPPAQADQCPSSEVVFARGTGEPAGLGGVGQAFVDSLQSQLPGQSIGVYAVNYPATNDYVNSALAGASDASAHVQNTVATCPNTKVVLGGYSQGAGVMDLVSNQLPPQTANHVAAVALFGNPSSSYANSLTNGQIPAVNSAYRPKTIDLCLPDDIICADGGNMVPHLMYVQAGMPDQAATYVASRLQPSPT